MNPGEGGYLQRLLRQSGTQSTSSSYSVACGTCCRSMCCLGTEPRDEHLQGVQLELKKMSAQVQGSSFVSKMLLLSSASMQAYVCAEFCGLYVNMIIMSAFRFRNCEPCSRVGQATCPIKTFYYLSAYIIKRAYTHRAGYYSLSMCKKSKRKKNEMTSLHVGT